jgi:hypothetical protein
MQQQQQQRSQYPILEYTFPMFNFNEKFTANRMLGCSQNNSDSRKFKTKAVSSQTIRSPNYKKRIRLESIRKLQAEVIPMMMSKQKKNHQLLKPSAPGGPGQSRCQ